MMTNSDVVVEIKADDEMFVPQMQTGGAAASDLTSSVDIDLLPFRVCMVDVGFSCAIPAGYHAKVAARSSMGKKGIIVPNAPGIIDRDYRGRVCVLLLNTSQDVYQIKKGDRIAQWLVDPNVFVSYKVCSSLSLTSRNGGFGSTGR